jgi:glycosyltransferase involved in cell wall biosynthesis
VIHTGVDTALFRPDSSREWAKAELGLDPARPVVGWLGRMEVQKAPLDFIVAVAELCRRYPCLQVVMAGEGRLRDSVAAAVAACGLADQIRLLPWQQQPARMLAAVEIFVLSSRWEGLPITLLEAMACGCAPVATSVDGSADVIEDGVSGLLVPAGEPGAMAAAIAGLLDDAGGRLAMGAAARRRIETSFTSDGMVDAWQRLLWRVAARASDSETAT